MGDQKKSGGPKKFSGALRRKGPPLSICFLRPWMQ